jgi:uncharacterized protein (DUF1697 family)
VALLRGINVGGRNIIRMHDVRRVFEDLGCKAVTTYIQSGNVLFESKFRNTETLSVAIEAALAAEFDRKLPVLVLTGEQLERVTKNAPPGFGDNPARYRYDVAFVKPPMRAQLILPTLPLRDGVDQAFERNDVLYFSRLTVKASQSHLPKLTRHPAYGSMTIRNWNTTTELFRLVSLE